VRFRVAEAVRLAVPARFDQLIAEDAAWLGAEPELAQVGSWLIEQSDELRQRAPAWLAMFPSSEASKRLAALASAPGPARDAAIAALGQRELRGLHPATKWPTDAIQIADEALIGIAHQATTDGHLGSDTLSHALRHVQDPALAAVIARAPALWGKALECFATPPLARVLLISLDDIAPEDRVRALRLIAATIGEEAVPMLLARAGQAPLEEKLETLFLSIACGGETHLPRLEDAIRGLPQLDTYRKRAKWHLANRWVVPTVRGLRVARMTATLTPEEREARCPQAADDLAALAKFTRHAEPYVYTAWAWMVRASRDPIRVRELVAAHPASQAIVRELLLEDLAKRGRVKQVIAAAQALDSIDFGALQLAIWGRPLAALELAASAHEQTAELVAARAIACYRAGRADLAQRIVVEDVPPPEPTGEELATFPGPHEQWLAEKAPGARIAVTALAGGAATLARLAKPAPHDADPDAASIDAIQRVARRLARGLPGATVYLAGDFKRGTRANIEDAIVKAGGRVVGGPFPGTDYYMLGERCPAQLIAELERRGTRRLRDGEVEIP
jgi:hypothetical protein